MATGNSQNDATVSPVRLLPHDNPCPNPQLPPLMIELDNPYVPQPGGRDQTSYATVIHAYQTQATNMTQLDQNEYLSLIKASYFRMDCDTERGPSHHPLYSKLQNEPTWAKFVFLSALYPEIKRIKRQPTPFQQQMISAFKCLRIECYAESYWFYSEPQRDDHHNEVLSSPSSGPHPDLLDAISTMQNAIVKLDEKLTATREEMRQQREQHEQHEKNMQNAIMRLDEKLDVIGEEMGQQREESKQKFKREIERILQLYS
ncbi:hypothetical protein A0O28_0026670 [Trichoderma guizhouense]|uniref:Uncharacterized protein n=1 Tax=Trichoderma guizhouense TaxID=1491466 RepID=A0A1T3CTE2_9HYPO|nr:hypothetical protein A0O28_0026670 [Trichoderma guizhouense]